MDKMTLTKTFLAAALAGGISLSASAQVLVNEDFESYDLSSPQINLGTNWTRIGTGTGTLSAAIGPDSSQAILRDSVAGVAPANAWTWTGSPFSVVPTNANPLVLTGDLWFSGATNQRTTIGLRNGANPLFELGFYNDPATIGLGARILNHGANNNWVSLANYETLGTDPRWLSATVTFTGDGVYVSVVDPEALSPYTLTSLGAMSANPFIDLRFGGPSQLNSSGGDSAFDNITLETIPEPSTYAAILGGLALLGAFVYRRRLSVKK